MCKSIQIKVKHISVNAAGWFISVYLIVATAAVCYRCVLVVYDVVH